VKEDPSEMIRQIESKVVNRLRQVTSAIRQDGANQVSIISASAERAGAAEFARAAATRARVVGEALQRICADPEVAEAMFRVLESNELVAGEATLPCCHRARTWSPTCSPAPVGAMRQRRRRHSTGRPGCESVRRRC